MKYLVIISVLMLIGFYSGCSNSRNVLNDDNDQIQDHDENDLDDSDSDSSLDFDISDIDIDEDSDDSDIIVYNCENILKLPVELKKITGFTNSEDFDFFDKYLVSSNETGDIVKQTIDGKTKVLSPQVGSAAGMRYLSDGSLVVANVEKNALIRVFPNGGTEDVLSNIQYPNGVEVDENDWIYVAEHNTGKIIQIKPDTKEHKYIAAGMLNTNGLSFSPDYKTLYCGSFGAGIIYKIDRLENNEWAAAEVFARTPNAPSWGCDSLSEGASCSTEMGVSGICEKKHDELLCVAIDPDVAACLYYAEGDFCYNFEVKGLCLLNDKGHLACDYSIDLNGCDNKKDGYSCLDDDSQEGKCENDGGDLICKATSGCNKEGDICYDSINWMEGLCLKNGDELECDTSIDLFGCDNKKEGYSCYTEDNIGFYSTGICTDISGVLECVEKDNSEEACDKLSEKDGCNDNDGEGICLFPEGSDKLSCDNNYQHLGCEGKEDGFYCTNENYFTGVCKEKNGSMECEIKDDSIQACTGSYEGAFCYDSQGEGLCVYTLDNLELFCDNSVSLYGCDGKKENYSCIDESGNYGFCQDVEGELICSMPTEGCDDKEEGDICMSDGLQGICRKNGEELECKVQLNGSSGGLDGLNVDMCGYVYVTEYTLGKIWRFTPDGKTVELFAETGVPWIPNLHWGNGIGGWGKTTLYVMERGNGFVFYIDTLVPGKEYLRPAKN
ncbi:MAG TPA: hypothetical protein VLJ60_08515 [bacterium]|nr:hypothetical protein [bacterium]